MPPAGRPLTSKRVQLILINAPRTSVSLYNYFKR